MVIPLSHIEQDLILEIVGGNENSTKTISEQEAMEFGEALYQIKEGCSYEYNLNNPNYQLSDKTQIVSISKFSKNRGLITPNIYVGTLTLDVLDKEKNIKGTFNIEVQSVKSSYRKDYRYMLESITEKCTELIMQIDSPINQHFETNFDIDNRTLYQKFSFAKSVIDSKEFEEAIQKIISNPTTKWNTEIEEKDIRNIRRFTQNNIKQIVSKSNRVKLPSNFHLNSNYDIDSIPSKIESTKKIESIDTAENRFIKHSLEVFLFFCENCQEKFNKYSKAKLEATNLATKLSHLLNQSFFKEISRPNSLKLNSTILQRKSGYREVLNAWLKFDLAAKLTWSGGDNVYEVGKKNIAALYEYWLFFYLLDLFKEIFKIEPKSIQELIQFDSEKLSLNLKQGTSIALEGIYKSPTRNLNIQFSYNRSFGGGKTYPKSGSYTTTLRPDYTLSIWPAEIINSQEAEVKELITHIHFDAKYKVSNFYELITKSKEEELNEEENKELIKEEEEENEKGTFKNQDLLKMHAYKDAIRRTSGAYVLYPGKGKDEPFRGFHELIPGLGAFVVRPNQNPKNKEVLKKFILKVIDNFLDRASQRENLSSKVYNIFQKTKDDLDILKEPMPEYLNGKKLIPDETFVLVGFSKDQKRLDWYEEHGLYNFRMNDNHGSLIFENDVVNSKYLLIRESGNDKASRIYKILSKGPRVFSKEKLSSLQYPNSENLKDHYLVIDIEKKPTLELGNKKWLFKELNRYKEIVAKNNNLRISAGIPFPVSLTELMKVIEK
ncbi:DUF2357 domain-containing protein [Flavobacterium sp.]|uniref:DUF2357 domain-containing protein n=1 Tax=Flavobacterium sp. TaxID=239 RepID=UPI00261B88CE|nr:DUF2357 domain-containing protein [Flavobacterium sp.]